MPAATNRLYIPDTSVLIKWFNQREDHVKQALAFRKHFQDGKVDIRVPAFLSWELNNYLGRHYPSEAALEAFSHFKMQGIPIHLLSLKTSGLAFEIMDRFPKVSFYDASFHALALSLDGTFLTCDQKYFQKAHAMGHIQLLKDYPTG